MRFLKPYLVLLGILSLALILAMPSYGVDRSVLGALGGAFVAAIFVMEVASRFHGARSMKNVAFQGFTLVYSPFEGESIRFLEVSISRGGQVERGEVTVPRERLQLEVAPVSAPLLSYTIDGWDRLWAPLASVVAHSAVLRFPSSESLQAFTEEIEYIDKHGVCA